MSESGSAGVLADNDLDAIVATEFFCLDWLIGSRVGEHRSDMDARLVRENGLADQRFVRRNQVACVTADRLSELGKFCRFQIRFDAVSDLKGHGDLLQRCIACTFAKTSHRHVDMFHAGFPRGQSIGCR